MKVTVSIIICTYNRAESLRATLESINHAIVPGEWKVELLVVDNNPTGKTKAVVESASLRKINLRYTAETNPGLSFARNTGLRESTGEIILFTDDDIRVPTNWIKEMCEPLITGRADAVAGGVIFPPHINALFSPLPPVPLRSWLASTEELDPVRPARMVGANMAFHRRVLENVPGFDVELGAGNNALGSGDETLFSLRLIAAGYKLAGALETAVEHHFEPDRLESSKLILAARTMGRTQAFFDHHWEHTPVRFAGIRLLATKVKLQGARIFYPVHKGRNEANLTQVVGLEYSHAFYREYRTQVRRPAKYPKHMNPSNAVTNRK